MGDHGWLQCVQEFPGDQQIFERFEALFMAAGGLKDAALFSRQHHKTHTYLISPAFFEVGATADGRVGSRLRPAISAVGPSHRRCSCACRFGCPARPIPRTALANLPR